MRILIAPDSFKGSLSSQAVIDAIIDGAKRVFKDAEYISIPIADGGEGTVKAIVDAAGGKTGEKTVTGPLGEPVAAVYGELDKSIIIEMAACSGLTLIPEQKRNPLFTTSYGTGEMIKYALDKGYRKIFIGIGGSATNDGGTGMAQALGVRFLDKEGHLMGMMSGKSLSEIGIIDVSKLDVRLKEVDIQVMCDVNNPLTGENGATNIYGKQKGADELALRTLERGMRHYQNKLTQLYGKNVGDIPGAGAAGGIGAALYSFCGGKLVSGIDTILELVKFEDRLKKVDLIITGEGRMDGQSAKGKVVYGIAKRAKTAGVCTVAVTGGLGEGYEKMYDVGVNAIITLPDRPMSLDYCMDNASVLISRTVYDMCRLLQIGKAVDHKI